MIISLHSKGLESEHNALAQLFYHLLIRGIDDENKKGRAVLPRSLQVWKDAEEEGSDRLLIAELDDKLQQASSSRFDNKLNISFVRYADSEHNLFLQIADLLSASANRFLNQPGLNRNHKTEFAEFLLDKIGVDENFSTNDNVEDMLVHLSL